MLAGSINRLFKASVLFTVLIFLSLPSWSKDCKKGKPCGNTCIPITSQCHIGSAIPIYRSSTPPSSPPQPMQPLPAEESAKSQGHAQSGIASEPSIQLPASCGGDPTWQWVSSYADGIYFRAGCSAAQDLSPANRRYFPTEESAQAAGYRRSRTPGC